MWKSLYTRVFTIRNTEWLILFVLAVTVIGMPLSRFMMSFGTVGIPIAWIISGNYAYKWNNLKQNKFLWPIMGIFVLHLLWIWRTPNSGHAVTEVVDMLYVAFGTEDDGASMCDLLPLFFELKGKHNYKIHAFIGCGHNFEQILPDGKSDYENMHWQDVMDEFIDWCEKTDLY